MGICSISRIKVSLKENEQNNGLEKSTQLRIKASARYLIDLQNQSKSKGFKKEKPNTAFSHSLSSVSFAPIDFEGADSTQFEFMRFFRLTEEFIEIKGYGFEVFASPQLLRSKLTSKNIEYLSTFNTHTRFYRYRDFDLKNTVIMKISNLDPYDPSSFAHFINSKEESRFFKELNNGLDSNHSQTIIKTPIFPLLKFSTCLNIPRAEFWKTYISKIQLYDAWDFRLDELLIFASKARLQYDAEKITKIIFKMIIQVNEFQMASDESTSKGKVAKELKSRMNFIRPCDIGIQLKKNSLQIIPWQFAQNVSPEYSFTLDSLQKLGKDYTRISLLLITIFLLELLGQKNPLCNLVQKLRHELVASKFFNQDIFYKIIDALNNFKDKEFEKIQIVLKFLFKDLTEIKPLKTILNYFRLDSQYLSETSDLSEIFEMMVEADKTSEEKSFQWVKMFYQSELSFVLRDFKTGIVDLKNSMNAYKDFRSESPNDPNLCEIFLLFSSYLFVENDYKSGIHYLKEGSKLKGKIEDSTTYCLMKIQLYVLSLKHLRNSADQHNILINIIKGFIKKITDPSAVKIMCQFIKTQLTKEYTQKLVGHLFEMKSVTSSADLKNSNVSLTQKRAISMDRTSKTNNISRKFSIFDDSLKRQSKENAQSSISKDENDYVFLLKSYSSIFKERITSKQKMAVIDRLIDREIMLEVLGSPSYCLFLNELLFYYIEMAESEKVKSLVAQIFETWINLEDDLDFRYQEKSKISIMGNFFINLLLINDKLGIVTLADSWTSDTLMSLLSSDEKTFSIPVNRYLIRFHTQRNDIFLASSAIDRLLFKLNSDSEIHQHNNEINQLLFLKIELSKLSLAISN
jgi:hypothetical protein